MSSGVVKKMFGEFTATDSIFNVVPVIVKTNVKGCLALSSYCNLQILHSMT